MVTRRKNSLQKGLKEYIVPIVGLFLILILIFSIFSGDEPQIEQINLENRIGANIFLDSSSTESYIVYPGEFKKKVEGDISLYKGEKIIIKEGTVSISLPMEAEFKLNKLGELKFLENGNFSLFSSDLWLNSISGVNLDMRFASIVVGDDSNISFSQNEMGSTIYLLAGFAEVSNLVGENTVLAPGQKITISRLDASKEDLELSLLKEQIDDYYKQSDWFIKNSGMKYLNNSSEDEKALTGSTLKNTNLGSSLINILNLSDESYVSSDSINISGNYNDEGITKITINGISASIDSILKTFKFENILVPNKENDLVFKIYDDSNDLLSKFIFTVYYDGAITTSNSTSKFTVQTFDVDGSQFTFSSIKDGVVKQLNGKTTYITYGDRLTIYGSVSSKAVKKVSVNGYTLKSFNGTSWRYHPSTFNNNLSNGTNVYEIKYYGEGSKLLYTNHFTIIKKSTEKKIYSDEASIN